MFTRALSIAAACTLACAVQAVAATVPIGIGTLSGVRDLGSAPASVPVRVAVVLNYHHDDEIDALTEAQADPDSPLYHHFLTPSEFAAYFAPTPAEYGRVVASLRRGGFTITHTFPNRTVVDAVAPAPVAARYFATDIHSVLSADAQRTYTNVRPGTVPADIGDAVYAVVGLDAAHRLHPAYVFPKPGAVRMPVRAVTRDGNPVFGPDGGYGPQVFTNSYDLPALGGHTGTGRASGVATDNDFLDSDLAAYLSYFGVARTGPATTRVQVDGGPGPGLGPDSVETTLDVETIVSLAPGTALYVYEAPYDEPTNANFIDIYNQVVSDNLVDTLNSSYTYCETGINLYVPGYTKSVEKVEKQGSALGITFHAAAGDSGSYAYGCSSSVSIGEPVDTPHNIAVGGTTLSVDQNGNETGEVGWGGTGGGVSIIFKLPSYQKKVPNVITSGRNIPDITSDADPGTGESFYYDGGFGGPIGGTSLASPTFGAALTEIDQLTNSRAGWFNVSLYRKWLKDGYAKGSTTYFRDITQGSIPPYNAGPGYDQMSGIGSMQVTNFAALLKKK